MCVGHVCSLYVCMYPCTYLRMLVGRFDVSISLYVCRPARLLSCLPASIHLFISSNVMICHIMFLNLIHSNHFNLILLQLSSLYFSSSRFTTHHLSSCIFLRCLFMSKIRAHMTRHNIEVAVLFMRCLLRHACCGLGWLLFHQSWLFHQKLHRQTSHVPVLACF